MITVFGSLNVDYVFQVPALPAPGETLLATNMVVLPGGKGGNQALAAARAGATVDMAGAVGDDGLGHIAIAGLLTDGVNTEAVALSEQPTGTASINVDRDGENAIVVFAGANADASHAQLTHTGLEKGGLLLLQMEIPVGEMAQAIGYANEISAKIIWNLAPMQSVEIELLRQVTVLVVNEIELVQLGLHLGLPKSGGTASLLSNVAQQTGNSVVLTLGAKGCLADHHGEQIAIPALPVSPIDTVGAGDAFCGAFAAALDAGEPFSTALQWGCVAGSLACLKTGAQTALPSREEIAAHLLTLPA